MTKGLTGKTGKGGFKCPSLYTTPRICECLDVTDHGTPDTLIQCHLDLQRFYRVRFDQGSFLDRGTRYFGLNPGGNTANGNKGLSCLTGTGTTVYVLSPL